MNAARLHPAAAAGPLGVPCPGQGPLPSAPVSDKQPLPPPPDAAAALGGGGGGDAALAVTRLCSVKQAAPGINVPLYSEHYGRIQSALGTVCKSSFHSLHALSNGDAIIIVFQLHI